MYPTDVAGELKALQKSYLKTKKGQKRGEEQRYLFKEGGNAGERRDGCSTELQRYLISRERGGERIIKKEGSGQPLVWFSNGHIGKM